MLQKRLSQCPRWYWSILPRNSKFNISKIVAIPDNQKVTTQRAELYALSAPYGVPAPVNTNASQHAQQPVNYSWHDPFRLIVGTDSSYLVNPVCTLREMEAWAFRLTKNKRGVII
jgi:hypothetical protein